MTWHLNNLLFLFDKIMVVTNLLVCYNKNQDGNIDIKYLYESKGSRKR